MRAAIVAALVTALFAGVGSARAQPYHLVFSADRDGDRDLYAVAAEGGPVVAITHNSHPDAAALLSPDRSTIALRRGGDLVVLRADDSERVVGHGSPLAWAPDGTRLAYTDAARSHGLRVADVRQGSTAPVASSSEGIWFASWSADGRQIGLQDGGGSGYVVDPATKRARYIDFIDIDGPTWSPAGGAFAYSNSDGVLRVVVAHGKWFAAHGDGLSWSPDGRSVAYRSWYGRASGVSVLDLRTRRVLHLASARALPPTWSPVGDRLAFVQSGRVVVVGRGGDGRVILRDSAGAAPARPVWSPDGRYVAFVVDRGGPAIVVADSRGGRARVVARGRRIALVGWRLGAIVGPNAPLRPPARIEEADGTTLVVRGKVREIAAEGARVALLVTESRVCAHVAVWRVGGAPLDLLDFACGDTFTDLRFHAGRVTWAQTDCGNDCYATSLSWRVGNDRTVRGGAFRDVGDDRPSSAPPPASETVGGVTAHLTGGRLVVRDHVIQAPSPIVDFELTSAGLFYTYRGHVVFVPVK